MGNLKQSAYIAFLFLGTIWGSNFIFIKWAVEIISVAQVTFLRIFFGFIPTLCYAIIRGNMQWHHWKYWYHFLAMSLFASSIYYYAFAKGTSLLYSGIAGMLSGAVPICGFVVAFLFLKEEHIDLKKTLGIAIGFFGVVLIARPWDSGTASLNIEGVIYMLVGSLSAGASFVYTKKFILQLKIPSDALVTYQLGLATLMMFLLTDFEGITLIQHDSKALWGMILGTGLAGTGIAFILYYHIINKLGAITATSVTYLPPVVALIIGWFVAEPIGLLDIIAMFLILAGVLLLKKQAEPKQKTC